MKSKGKNVAANFVNEVLQIKRMLLQIKSKLKEYCCKLKHQKCAGALREEKY